MTSLKLNEIKYKVFLDLSVKGYSMNINEIKSGVSHLLDVLQSKNNITASQHKNISIDKLSADIKQALDMYYQYRAKPITFSKYKDFEEKTKILSKGYTPISDETEIEYLLVTNSRVKRFYSKIGFTVYDIEGDYLLAMDDDEVRIMARRPHFPIERSLEVFSRKLGIVRVV